MYWPPERYSLLSCKVLAQKRDTVQSQRQNLHSDGTELQLFQDLSNITLQHRRDLRQILELLRSRNITHCCKFPFSLSASILGCTALLWPPTVLQKPGSATNWASQVVQRLPAAHHWVCLYSRTHRLPLCAPVAAGPVWLPTTGELQNPKRDQASVFSGSPKSMTQLNPDTHTLDG